MMPTAELLAPEYRIYVPDLPGFGRSSRPARAMDIPMLAEALAERMDVFGVSSAVMLANSMGCQIVAQLATRYPERIMAAVMIGPTMDIAARTMPAQMGRLLWAARHESLGSIMTQSYDYMVCGPTRTFTTLNYALNDPVLAHLPALRSPTLVIRGEHDAIAPRHWCAQFAAALPDATLLEIPGAPHAANHTSPEPVAQATRSFLAERVLA